MFYHLRYPMLALDKLRKVTRGKLLLQTVATEVQRQSVKVPGDIPLRSPLLQERTFPKLHFVENLMDGDGSNWWVPNSECVEAMLRSSGFVIEKRLSRPGDHEAALLCSAAQSPWYVLVSP